MTAPHDSTAIFLHLGKTGGSTLGNVIDRQYTNDRLYVIYGNDDNDRFAALPESSRADLDCVRGITYFGIHQHIPRPVTYFTILRDPVDRVISQYFYNIRRRQRDGVTVKRERSLEQMLDFDAFQVQFEMQLRMIVGGDSMRAALWEPLPENALDIAKRNLESHFTVVGVMDRFDETLLLMKHQYGWGNVVYGHRNLGTNKPRRDSIPDHVITRIQHKCQRETELYTWVCQQFAANLAAQPTSFASDLARFKRNNAIYNRLWQSTIGIRQTAAWRKVRQTIAPTWRPPVPSEDS